MRKGALVAAVLALASFAAGSAGAASKCGGKDDDDGRKTLAGSCKSDSGHIVCGTTNEIASAGTISIHQNVDGTTVEIETCNDEGSPNEHGRALIRIDGDGQHAILDSDRAQWDANNTVSAGYLIENAGPKDPGVWCNDNPTPTDPAAADGYAVYRSGASPPGTQSGPQCLPTQ